jgi:transposase
MPNEHYDASFKQRVLQQYRAGRLGCGFKALANRFKVRSWNSIKEWHQVWDGTIESLQRKPGQGRKRILTHKESEKHIKRFVEEKNRVGKAVGYGDVIAEVKRRTGKEVSATTVKRIGRDECKLSEKKTARKLAIEGSSSCIRIRCRIAACCVVTYW